MSKIFDFDARKGSLIEPITGVIGVFDEASSNDAFLPDFKRLEKGLAVANNGTSHGVDFAVDTEVIPITLEAWARYIDTGESYTGFLTNKSGANSGVNLCVHNATKLFQCLIGDGISLFEYTSPNVELVDGNLYQLVASITSGGLVTFYINGELVGSDQASTVTSPGYGGNTKVLVNGFYNTISSLWGIGENYRGIIYDHIITPQEVANSYRDFLRSFPVARAVKDNLDYVALKPTDLSHLVDSRIGNPDINVSFDMVKNMDLSDDAQWIDAGGVTATTENSFTTTGIGGRVTSNIYLYPMTGGKTYLIKYDFSVSNQLMLPDLYAVDGIGVTSPRLTMGLTGTGDKSGWVIFTCPYAIGGMYIRNGAVEAGTFTVNTLEITEWNGEELVPDADVGFYINKLNVAGGFGFTPYTNNIVEQDRNFLKCTYVDHSNGMHATLGSAGNNTFNANAGAGVWEITLKYKLGSGSTVDIGIYDGSVYQITSLSSETETVLTIRHTQLSATPIIRLYNMAGGDVAWIEMLSVMKVTGLVAAYNMTPNGATLVDISGEGNNMAISSPIISTKEGLASDGVVGTVGVASAILDGLTFATWVIRFKTNETGVLKTLFNQSYNGRCFQMYITNNKLLGRVTGSSIITGTSDVNDGQWHNAVMVLSGSLLLIYVDGNLEVVGTDAAALEVTGDDNISFFCAKDDGGSAAFGKHIAEKGEIYNYAWPEEKIVAEHNQFAKEVKHKDRLALDFGVGDAIG